MLKMSTISRNARVQTFAKVVDSFVDCLPRSAAVHFLALGWSLALTEVCEMLDALDPTHGTGSRGG